ncbi:MAG: hypothetical protein M0Q00_04305 [Acholeplasmataceae bacterium]|jgi:hypothetical protein|nr:hypothetical protein [Acholeplasmataceae bacterium]MDD2259633.1 hypothetical protein [Acholeplasmataceae bacterium]MDD4468490.1 hypothetical protein [Acholeplasmataceae bacterium]
MSAIKMIEELNNLKILELKNPTYIGILPNDGDIIPGYPQAILTYDETHFNIYTFKGLIKFKFDGNIYKYAFSDLREIELGKYNFKNHYIKLTFDNEKFIAFTYFKKVRQFPEQLGRINLFIKLLESTATVIESDRPFTKDM